MNVSNELNHYFTHTENLKNAHSMSLTRQVKLRTDRVRIATRKATFLRREFRDCSPAMTTAVIRKSVFVCVALEGETVDNRVEREPDKTFYHIYIELIAKQASDKNHFTTSFTCFLYITFLQIF